MTPEEELSRASEAETVLKNPLFKEAVREVREALISGIERTAFSDEKLREKLAQQLISLSAVLTQLKGYMETGQLAEATLKERALRMVKSAVNW